MTVAQLRDELERLERHGCGAWEVEVAPAHGVPHRSDGQPDLAFDVCPYGVVGVTALGDGSVDFVLMKFAPSPVKLADKAQRAAA
jgi:hypothetical protein